MSLLTTVLGLWSADVGIDLGTANTLVHVRGRGIVLNEPSVVAISRRTGQVLSVGTEARKMLGRTPADIVAMRPLRDGVIAATSARVGGDEMDDAIVQYVRRTMGLLIGERTAEDIKMAMGSAFPLPNEKSFIVRGRDLITGLPKTVEMTTAHVREALSGVLFDIVRAVKSTLDATPSELLEDIMHRGMVVCGGGALLTGLDQLLAHETLMPVRVAPDPLTCVVRGTGIVLEEIDTLNRVLLRTRKMRALRY